MLSRSSTTLLQKMLIRVFCNAEKKRKVEVDFGNGGLLFGEKSLVEELPALASLLEGNLEGWSQHLKDLRNKFSALNFFRTDQLVELSETIASCLSGKEVLQSSRMLFDLMSRDISLEEISEIFSTTLKDETDSEPMEAVEEEVEDAYDNEHWEEEGKG